LAKRKERAMITKLGRIKCLTVILIACVAFLAWVAKTIAQEDQSTVKIIDKKKESFTVRTFNFTDSGKTIEIGIPTLTYSIGQLQGKNVHKEIKRIIPLVSINTITVIKPGVARIVLQSGSTSTIPSGNYSIKGKQDLGELGSGDFSISNDIKEMSFSWSPPRSSNVKGLWPTDTSKPYRGKVNIGAMTLVFDRMAIYYQTSGSSCPIHSWCIGCNQRTYWSNGHIADTIKINKSNTEVQLELSKIRQIDIVNYPDVSITLKSGTKTDCKLLLGDNSQGVLAYDSEGWIFVPREKIRSIEFEE
jgi:hypothetical protein